MSKPSARPNGPPPDVPLRDVIEAFLEHAPDGVVVTDRDHRIALMNRWAEELFGYDPHEVVGKPVEVLLPGGLPEPDGADPNEWEAVFVLPGVHKDGSDLPVRVDLSYPDAGGVLAATAFVRKPD